ncbi:putative lipoprotein (DUF799 domain) [Campylobacter ureolyticus RIGS 9880]|uniref:Lipoprotein (DUF799 domain) n=1 Tax=Campylobacter ureolyticus RIGS 9880 TaxID=1032069 RepID=A0AAU8U9X6_9BACT|nr:DUF799 domain-containing protein [Campylobacter ureolyticus]AKT90314.1 putative lipoprotein (DUF799 domain) [Campylobacter ureolyticus RIGS 9880]
MKNSIFITLILSFIFVGCAKKPEIYDYSAFLESKPKSILVVMPTNESVDIKASPAMLANATMPLAEAGYYVFPVALVNDTFKFNGVYDANDIKNIPLNKLQEIFGADSVLYINITKYGTSYAILNSQTTVEADVKLVDLKTGKTLWDKRTLVSNNSANANQGLIGMLITAAIDQIANTIADSGYDMSVLASNSVFATDCHDCILKGPRSPSYGQDKQLTQN